MNRVYNVDLTEARLAQFVAFLLLCHFLIVTGCCYLAVVFVTRRQIRFDVVMVIFNVLDDVVFDRPFEEVELANSCNYVICGRVKIADTVPSFKRVKIVLRECLQLRSIVQIYVISGRLTVANDLGIVFLTIVRNKPIDQSQRYRTFSFYNGYQNRNVGARSVKLRQGSHYQVPV